MLKMNKAAAALLAAAVMLGGCAVVSPDTVRQPDLTFAQYAPVSLDVAKIEVYDQFTPPATGGHIEREFATPPDQAATRLLEAKLRPDGAAQILRVYIDDASVVSEKQPVRDDLMGKFTRETAEIYRAHLAIHFELANTDAPDIVIGNANITSDRTTSILENTSLADRDRTAVNLTEALMKDVYAGMTGTVRETFGFK
jgi:hypothetical protein